MVDWKVIYQKLYDTSNYGRANENRCPGARYFPHYKSHLIPNVIDIGCGTGDTVRLMRSQGINADGIDWVYTNDDMMVRDIRTQLELRGYQTAICMDVLEHIEEEYIHGVLSNLRQCQRQVVTVHSGPAKSYPPHDLHVTQWSLGKWEKELRKHFRIKHSVVLQDSVRKLYLLE